MRSFSETQVANLSHEGRADVVRSVKVEPSQIKRALGEMQEQGKSWMLKLPFTHKKTKGLVLIKP